MEVNRKRFLTTKKKNYNDDEMVNIRIKTLVQADKFCSEIQYKFANFDN